MANPAAPFKFKVKWKQVHNRLEREQRTFVPDTRKTLYVWSERVLMLHALRRMSGGTGVKVRSGALRRAFDHEESGDSLGSLKTTLYADRKRAPSARIHEYGGTILPRIAKMLALPLEGSPAVRSSGEPLYHSPLRSTLPELGFHVRRSSLSLLYLVDRYGRAWFRLKSFVQIPARLKFRATVRAEIDDLCSRLAAMFRKRFKSG